jgi:hypothetical protein
MHLISSFNPMEELCHSLTFVCVQGPGFNCNVSGMLCSYGTI